MKDDQFFPACEPGSARRQSQTNPRQHVLVAEDDSSLRQFNTEALMDSGYAVDTAEDGAAAWQALNYEHYDLLLTDNNMPNMSGVELLQKIWSARMALPVIMASGNVPQEAFHQHPWLRPTATLPKPYTLAEMVNMVKKVLRETENTANAASQIPASFSHRILVVDEDGDMRQLYAEALAAPGYQVDTAEDGAVAWQALQANRYDLLITEHGLPKMTGVALVKNLRAAHMALPVVMAAARLPMEALDQSPALQLAATLEKPFVLDALLTTVLKVLRMDDGPHGRIGPKSNGGSLISEVSMRL